MHSTFDKILSSRPDPLDVLKTTAFVVQHARCVKIHQDSTKRAADELVEKRVEPPAWNYAYHFFDGTARTVNYLFLLDALNFCFWGRQRWTIEYHGKKLDGYWALAASLKRAAQENPRILDAEFMARISPQELENIFGRNGKIPLFAERWRNVRELGTVLQDRWSGNAARLVESAQCDAARLARMIAESFPSFNDVAVYNPDMSLRGVAKRRSHALSVAEGNPQVTRRLLRPVGARNDTFDEVHFFKRAQILVADLWGAFGDKQWGAFKNIDVLTAFADYKLPQVLRAWGVLRYAPSLARKVDSQIELAAGSAEEVEIRAATLWAVEFLREALAARGRAVMSIQLDWALWEASQGKFKGIKPYHRVKTIFY